MYHHILVRQSDGLSVLQRFDGPIEVLSSSRFVPETSHSQEHSGNLQQSMTQRPKNALPGAKALLPNPSLTGPRGYTLGYAQLGPVFQR